MKILSELFKIIAIITYITMIITVIVVPSDDNVYEYMFYELAIFLFSSYSKCRKGLPKYPGSISPGIQYYGS